MSNEEFKKLGRKQKLVLVFVYSNTLKIDANPSIRIIYAPLVKRKLVSVVNNLITLTSSGRNIVNSDLLKSNDCKINSLEELLDLIKPQIQIYSPKIKKLGKRQKLFLQLLISSSLKLNSEIIENSIVANLRDNNLIEFDQDHIKITEKGRITLHDPINNGDDAFDEGNEDQYPEIVNLFTMG